MLSALPPNTTDVHFISSSLHVWYQEACIYPSVECSEMETCCLHQYSYSFYCLVASYCINVLGSVYFSRRLLEIFPLHQQISTQRRLRGSPLQFSETFSLPLCVFVCVHTCAHWLPVLCSADFSHFHLLKLCSLTPHSCCSTQRDSWALFVSSLHSSEPENCF